MFWSFLWMHSFWGKCLQFFSLDLKFLNRYTAIVNTVYLLDQRNHAVHFNGKRWISNMVRFMSFFAQYLILRNLLCWPRTFILDSFWIFEPLYLLIMGLIYVSSKPSFFIRAKNSVPRCSPLHPLFLRPCILVQALTRLIKYEWEILSHYREILLKRNFFVNVSQVQENTDFFRGRNLLFRNILLNIWYKGPHRLV